MWEMKSEIKKVVMQMRIRVVYTWKVKVSLPVLYNLRLGSRFGRVGCGLKSFSFVYNTGICFYIIFSVLTLNIYAYVSVVVLLIL